MDKYILICNPDDFELCTQAIQITNENAKVEILQSDLVNTGKIIYLDTTNVTATSFPVPVYK